MSDRPSFTVVPKDREVADDARAKAQHLVELIENREVGTFICAAFRPSGDWVMIQSGQFDALRKVGILECMKLDLARSMDKD